MGLAVLLDDMADIAQGNTRFYQVDRLVQAFLGDSDQPLCVGWNLADSKHLAGITVKTVLNHRDIDIDDVPGFQDLAIAGYAVTDDLVYRGADRLGESVVVERGGDSLLVFDDILVTETIQFTGTDTLVHMGADHF